MDDLQTNDTQDTELPDTIKNWVTAQHDQQQSIQMPPAVQLAMKAQSPAPVAPSPMAVDPAAAQQAQQILQPQGSRQALAAKLYRPSIGQTIGNAFAGIGDAIGNASGGHTEFLKNAMQGQKDKADAMLDSADKDTAVSKDKFALAQQLMKDDSKSIKSQQTQDANMAILQKTLGMSEEQVRKLSANQIEALGGKPVDFLKAKNEGDLAQQEAQNRADTLKEMVHRDNNEAQAHRDMMAHEDKVLGQQTTNEAAQRKLQGQEDQLKAATDLVHGFHPIAKMIPGSDYNQALHTLASAAQPDQPATPKPGEVVQHTDGTKWQFLGGNPSDKNSWRKS